MLRGKGLEPDDPRLPALHQSRVSGGERTRDKDEVVRSGAAESRPGGLCEVMMADAGQGGQATEKRLLPTVSCPIRLGAQPQTFVDRYSRRPLPSVPWETFASAPRNDAVAASQRRPPWLRADKPFPDEVRSLAVHSGGGISPHLRISAAPWLQQAGRGISLHCHRLACARSQEARVDQMVLQATRELRGRSGATIRRTLST